MALLRSAATPWLHRTVAPIASLFPVPRASWTLTPVSSAISPFLPQPRLPVASSPFAAPSFARSTCYGTEYHPSTLKRKRKFGFLSRLKTRNGRKLLLRRMLRGRKDLAK
ncbi:hypothetical protein DFJ73DRAFT_842339 [Zopfochytrium polystomum]|nr:hypothetical protein DFJ73DRAFT_842339 [Zopfochytrium polystomum]